MNGIVFAIPGDIDKPTGGYGYDRRLLAEWRAAGVRARHLRLPDGFPAPSSADIATTRRLLSQADPDATLLVDGLAFGAFPAELAAEFGARIVALVHHPLAHETGLTPAEAAALRSSERAALAHANRVVASSPSTRALLQTEYDVRADKIVVAVPGVDPAPRSRGGSGERLDLLAVGSVIPRKGYGLLVEALAGLPIGGWRLTIAGALDHAPATVEALRRQIDAAGLQDRILLAGAVTQQGLSELYDKADLFVMPSLFEGYGMVLTEALARGLPIVCTLSGAAADTVPDAAALKVPAGDATALADALARAMTDATLRRRLADASWGSAATLPRWHDTAALVARACLDAPAPEVTL
ncbi:MAG: glycosyl transferase family 1 [Chelatococcus sp.]|nr:MAG: glycosyl transferase family 1 [Chelatococcus sp.]